MSTFSNPAQTLAGLISNNEGYGLPGAVPTIANNPGDLELGDLGYGTTAAAGGNQITNFADPAAGLAALTNQINLMGSGGSAYYSPNETLSQAGSTYTGTSGGWDKILLKAGIDPNSKLGEFLGGGNAPSSPDGFSADTMGLGGKSAAIAAGVSTSETPEFLTRGVFIALGLLLIGGGILAFDKARAVVVNAGKAVGRTAQIASA